MLLGICMLGLAAPRLIAVVDWQDQHPRVIHGVGTISLKTIAAMLFTPVGDYKDSVTWGASGIWEYWSYVGGVPLALAAAAAVWRGPARGLALAFVLAGVFLAWQSPWGNDVVIGADPRHSS